VLIPGTGTYNVVANSLQDLSNRANRAFRHPIPTTTAPEANSPNASYAFPYPLNRTTLAALRSGENSLAGSNFDGVGNGVIYSGNDIVLTDIAAFDVKVFSPNCFLNTISGQLLEPSDPGYPDGLTGEVSDGDIDGTPSFADPDEGVVPPGIARGAYVDLGHHGGGQFSQTIIPPAPFYSATGTFAQRSTLNYRFLFESLASPTTYDASTAASSLTITNMIETVYDTWTPTYESDGLDQDDSSNYP
jgi:hypothetical protein